MRGTFSAKGKESAGRPGRVRLVGAGAGDASLLTLAARDAMQSADVVLFDDLVDGSVLDLIPNSVTRIAVGKRAGRRSTPQADIISTMIDFARDGKCVVRLKGGDPFIFGRGGEEAQALSDAAIDVDVIPGMTAALTAAAATGIPLTHRGVSTVVSFATAATKDDTVPVLAGLAGPGRTLVVYMGRDAAAEVVKALRDDQVSDATPVAVIENAGRANQRLHVATLNRLVETVTRMAPAGPTLLIIGDVVNERVAAAAPRAAVPAHPHRKNADRFQIPAYAPIADFHFAHG